MTWLRAIGAGVTSVRACFSGVSWASALPVALTTSMEAQTTSCRTSQAILGNTTGDGAIDAQGYSSPGIQRLDGAPHTAVTSISPAVTTACRLPAASLTGSGATGARACSTLGTQVLGSAQQAADTTTQAAGITASLDRSLATASRAAIYATAASWTSGWRGDGSERYPTCWRVSGLICWPDLLARAMCGPACAGRIAGAGADPTRPPLRSR